MGPYPALIIRRAVKRRGCSMMCAIQIGEYWDEEYWPITNFSIRLAVTITLEKEERITRPSVLLGTRQNM